ncbi:uncharacterized protein M421DRAFT_4849 [Didymella exigua CBS 183.55]|uniref:Myb-like domain-containing protein n=1 Tax=Didymella exigua CBS 183.55 TaxID=1150837 RepID=A0A6A5RNP2_9PLEO|nr:uncharacterized protein M421DRAFT_4849 [Didymella exigua CBS 183.55]KAF1929033.1 hypothetical protein M421DRAFT_4849 [Didymella exigua CBS 183.55]
MHQESSTRHTARRWTPADHALLHRLRFIELRTWPEVATALGRTTQAVQGQYYQWKIAEGAAFEKMGRWYEPQQQKKVLEDVLLVWRRKEEVEWSEKEDETIVQAWIDGKSEDDILHSVRFEGKYQCDVRQRYRLLLREKGLVYRRLMGMKESRPLPHGLDKALGKKYDWI